MAGPATADGLSRYREALQRLIEQHRELRDEPLRLAVAYLPAGRDPRHVYVLEVIDVPDPRINPERDLFEIVFEPTPGFPMGKDEQLHVILTNPHELETALKDSWPLAREVFEAIRAGDYEVMYKDQIGDRALAGLRNGTPRHEPAHG